jgi:pyroglutamyl-peptidase
MTSPLHILVTGFGPFPGAPYNPTLELVQRLTHLRRPAFADLERIGHVFAVSYRAIDHDLPALLETHRPHALLMFGLAQRTPHLRIETRARNAATTLWPDASGSILGGNAIAHDADARPFGPHTLRLLRAARATGIDARLSRDAGRYLCNYLAWRAIEATTQASGPRLAAFVHVPLVRRDVPSRSPGRITLEHLVDAGEAMLLEMAALVRASRRN